MQTDENNLPNGYSNIEEYKKEFIQSFLISNKIDELDNNFIYFLTSDDIFLSELVGTKRLSALLIKNFTVYPDLLVKTIERLSPENFSKLFNNEELANYINGLSVKDFAEIFKQFDIYKE